MQKTLYRTDRHIQHFGNFHRVEIFLIAEQYDHAGIVRQILDELSQPLAQEGVGGAAFGQRFGNGFEADAGTQTPFAGFVDCAAEPPRCVRRAFDLPKFFVKLQEYLLGQLFGASRSRRKRSARLKTSDWLSDRIFSKFRPAKPTATFAITDERPLRLQPSGNLASVREM